MVVGSVPHWYKDRCRGLLDEVPEATNGGQEDTGVFTWHSAVVVVAWQTPCHYVRFFLAENSSGKTESGSELAVACASHFHQSKLSPVRYSSPSHRILFSTVQYSLASYYCHCFKGEEVTIGNLLSRARTQAAILCNCTSTY